MSGTVIVRVAIGSRLQCGTTCLSGGLRAAGWPYESWKILFRAFCVFAQLRKGNKHA